MPFISQFITEGTSPIVCTVPSKETEQREAKSEEIGGGNEALLGFQLAFSSWALFPRALRKRSWHRPRNNDALCEPENHSECSLNVAKETSYIFPSDARTQWNRRKKAFCPSDRRLMAGEPAKTYNNDFCFEAKALWNNMSWCCHPLITNYYKFVNEIGGHIFLTWFSINMHCTPSCTNQAIIMFGYETL